jgi:hypothetical protein
MWGLSFVRALIFIVLFFFKNQAHLESYSIKDLSLQYNLTRSGAILE